MAEIVLTNAAVKIGDGTIEALASVICESIDSHSRIINATLVLSGVDGAGFTVEAQSNGGDSAVIDYITEAVSGQVFLNITEEVGDIIKNRNEKVTVLLPQGVAFDPAIDLKIEYIPERIMHEGNAYYDVGAGRAGSGRVNLATGGLNFARDDGAASGISHIYNSWQANKTAAYFEHSDRTEIIGGYGCGKGWKLNLHQYLVKREGTGGQDLYTYVDGNGNYHEFAERYYYIANEQKNYVDKTAVGIGFDGKLSYGGNEVKTELRTTSGLTLQTDLKGFAGWEKLELRSEDRAQLENEIEQIGGERKRLEKEIEQLENNINDLIQAQYAQAEQEDFNALIAAERAYQQKSEELNALQYSQNVFSNESRFYDEQSGEDMRDRMYDNKAALSQHLKKTYKTVSVQFYKDKNDSAKDKYYGLTAYYYNSANGQDSQVKSIASNLSNDNPALFQYAPAQYTFENEYEDHNIELSRLSLLMEEAGNKNQKETVAKLKEVLDAKNALTALRDDYARKLGMADAASLDANRNLEAFRRAKKALEENRNAIEDDYKAIEKVNNLLEAQNFQLARLIEQEPARYLSDNSGVILAFNEAGALIATADAYENVTYITYEDGKIVSVKDTDNRETKLEYGKDGLLERIIGADEKVIRFDYYNGTLSKATYPDGTVSEYTYIGEFNQLRTATDASGYGIKFTYDRRKITKVQEFTNAYEITDEGWRGADATTYKDLADIICKPHYTTLTDRLGNSKTYIFDILGKPVTVYEGAYYEPGENTKSVSMDYGGSEKAFSITDNILQDNLLENAQAGVETLNGDTTLGNLAAQTRQRAYEVDISKIPDGVTDLVLSAWAKADSAFIATERKTDYGYSTIDAEHIADADENKQNRKFELRAELEYSDGKSKTYSASFDWLNTDWQYLALPVTVLTDDEDGDRFVSRFPFVLGGEDRTLTKLQVIVDYSYNTNAIEADCVTLRQGSWAYKEFDGNGRAKYGEDDKGNKTAYHYDRNGNLAKTVLTDKQYREYVNTYEYNKQNKLVRSTDYNGLVEETVYDDKGRAVKSVAYNASDPTGKLYSESVRDEKGKVLADVDTTGEFNAAEYGYDYTGAVNIVTDACGGKTAYGYHNGELVSVSGTENGEENANTVKRVLGHVTRVSSGGTDYTYTYDGWGRQKAVSIAGGNYSSVEYVNDKTVKTTLASGESFTECADSKGDAAVEVTRLEGGESKTYQCKTAKTFYAPAGGTDAEQAVNYSDEETGLLIRSVDKSGEIQYTTDYTYDKDGRLTSKVEDGAGTVEQDIEYGGKGGIARNTYRINDAKELEYGYEYENAVDDRQIKVALPSGTEQTIGYDGLGRLTNISLGDTFAKEIYYLKSGDHATNMVSSVWHGVNGKRDKNTRYAYDRKGNIVSVKENGKEAARYAYDSLNRLIREDNAVYKEKVGGIVVTGKTETYEYDNNGNILAKTRYAYTTCGALSNGTRAEYGYSQSGWKDRLFGFGGEAIDDYDALGNPREYRGKDLAWSKGRQLAAMSWADENGAAINCAFTYNAAGIRTAKAVSGIETTYYLDGSKIIAEERRDAASAAVIDTLYYHYGVDGITGFEYKEADETGITYVYGKNVQGDITHIYTQDGQLVAQYIYDAWGNHSVCAATGYEGLAERNPFRYRGYYYDVTTKLYYLNSRYYDPQTGRFVNADGINYLDPEKINGLNLYAYCGNNAVMWIDPTGTMPFLLLTAIIGAVVGAIVGGIVAACTGGNIWIGIGLGAAIGGLIGLGVGALYAGAVAGSFFASVGAVVKGTSIVAATFSAGGFTAGTSMIIDNYSNAFTQFTHVFWSGGDIAKNEAKNLADSVGGKTLDMTRLGQHLESIPYDPQLWQLASQNFANQVSNYNVVFSVQNMAGVSINSIWATIEYSELIKKFVEIIYILAGGK